MPITNKYKSEVLCNNREVMLAAVKHDGDLARVPIRVSAATVEESTVARQAFISFHLKSRTNFFTKVFRKLTAAVQRRAGLQ